MTYESADQMANDDAQRPGEKRSIDRRSALKLTLGAAALGIATNAKTLVAATHCSTKLPILTATTTPTRASAMKLMCMIRYQIDPFQREAFKQYAETWGRAIPRAGGELVGYFLPYEGTNDIAWGLIAFESLAAYETYRAKLKTDAESVANFNFAQSKRFILREERTFVEVVDGTFRWPR